MIADDPTTPAARTTNRSPLVEAGTTAAIVVTKLLTAAFAVDAFLNADSPRLRGKAIRTRAIGYAGALLIVPVLWRLLPERGRYPRALDLAVTVPLLLDAAGNALDLYEEAHIDDLVHLANAAIVSGIAGALVAPQMDERWQAALAGAGVSVVGATAWELAEYGAMRLGANGMDLTYDDTMADLAEGVLGAALGALFTMTRVPRSRAGREQHGWRGPLGLREQRSVWSAVAGTLRLTYVGHATVLIELDGVRILTDPVLTARLGPLRRHGPTPVASELGPVDAVLISHAHPDHFHRASLAAIGLDPLIIVPRGMGPAAARLGHRTREVIVNERVDVGSVRVTAVPARHGRWPRHRDARPIGFLVEGTRSIYFAGDTALFPGMTRFAGRVDVALLPVGRWGPPFGPDRLSASSAIDAAVLVEAHVAIPIHWGTLYVPGFEAGRWGWGSAGAGAAFASEALRRAPDLEVVVLRPGEAKEIDA